MTNPWDAERVTPHDLDRCACGHAREHHIENRCWACYIMTTAPAYPDHAFHLVWPWLTPVQTSLAAAAYQPPRGWDRPQSTSRQ